MSTTSPDRGKDLRRDGVGKRERTPRGSEHEEPRADEQKEHSGGEVQEPQWRTITDPPAV